MASPPRGEPRPRLRKFHVTRTLPPALAVLLAIEGFVLLAMIAELTLLVARRAPAMMDNECCHASLRCLLE